MLKWGPYQEPAGAHYSSEASGSRGSQLAAGETMDNQAGEWNEMSQQQQDDIKDRLMAACETRAAVDVYRTPRDLWSKLVSAAR